MSLEDAHTFISGWVSGYLTAGGSLTDDGLGEKASAAFSRYLQPPDMPAPVVVELERAITAAKAADASELSRRRPS